MTRCDYCGKNIDGISFKCHRCTGHYCSKHHLPEDHNCPGLEKEKSKNQERWKKAFVENFSGKKHLKSSNYKEKKRDDSHRRKRNPFAKIKYFFIYKAKDFGDWLNDREHRKYDFGRRFNYLLGILIPLAISIVACAIFYSNAQKPNDVNLWIIKLGGVLILVSVFFIIKYGIRLIKELINILKRQRNWLKYLIIILLIFLLWQAYTNKETILNPVFDFYNQTNFSLFAPVDLGNFSFESDAYSSNSGSSNSGGGWLDGGSSRDINLIEQEILVLVNEERQKYGAIALTSKTNLNNFARGWSDKMISQNFFEHSNLNFAYPSIAGENIGETPIHYNVVGCGSTYSNNQMAKCFVDGWIGSPGHHENIIDKRFSMTGIGVSCDSSKCRATQVFSG